MRLHQTTLTRPSIVRLTTGLVALAIAASGCSAAASSDQEQSGVFTDPAPLIADGGLTALVADGVVSQVPADEAQSVEALPVQDQSEVSAAAIASLSAESGFVTEQLFVDIGYASFDFVLTTEWGSDGGERWLTVETTAPGMPEDWAAELEQGLLDALPKVWAGDTSFGPEELDHYRRELLVNLDSLSLEGETQADIVGDKLVSMFVEVPFENSLSWYRWDFGTGKSPAPRNS